MPFDGRYTKADIRKKVLGANARLAKNGMQAGVHLLMDTIGMMEQIYGHPLTLERPFVAQYLQENRVGAAEGGFRKAVINELLGEIIVDVENGNWQRAAWKVKDAVELVRRIGLSQNKEIKIEFTPDSLARHQV
jgi:hypothetical protein